MASSGGGVCVLWVGAGMLYGSFLYVRARLCGGWVGAARVCVRGFFARWSKEWEVA
jgi:hypothetical protein